MKIAVLGVGAMGSLFAARLSPVADVTMLGNWPAQLKTLQKSGLRLIQPDGREIIFKISATNDASQIPRVDLAIVLVKCWQTEQAAFRLKPLLAAEGLALTLQNGIGNLEILISAIGKERALLGVTSEGAMLIEPGVVRHAGTGLTHIAASPNTGVRSKLITQLFNDAGFDTHLVDNADSLVWGKLAVNAGINPITALLQVPNGFLAQNVVARALMTQAAEEAAAVAQAQHIALPYESATRRTLEVAQATATNRSSMAQDVARGTPTEIEAISGAIIRLGQTLNVPTPVNEVLYRLVKEQVSGRAWRASVKNLSPKQISLISSLAALETTA